MTVQELHDALTELPMDLIAAVDKVRRTPAKPAIHWKRWSALAACLMLMLSFTLLWKAGWLPAFGGSTKEAIPEAPMAAPDMARPEAAPILPESVFEEVPAEEAAPEENADITADRGHSHSFAEDGQAAAGTASGYCGNTRTIVYLNGSSYELYGSDSIALTHILNNLPYASEICRCMAEFTVDTERITGIEVNLTEGFARYEKGQANLTKEQAETIRAIIENLN